MLKKILPLILSVFFCTNFLAVAAEPVQVYWPEATLSDLDEAIKNGFNINDSGENHFDYWTEVGNAVCSSPYVDVVEAAVKYSNSNTPERLTELLAEAIAKGSSIPAIEQLIKMGADVNGKGHNAEIPMIFTASSDDINILVKHGVNIDALDSTGYTPLLNQLATTANEDTVRALVLNGTNVNRVYNDNTSVLDVAIKHKFSNSLYADIIKAGANTSATTKSGYTLLMHAIKKENLPAIEELLKGGANVNDKNLLIAGIEAKDPLILSKLLANKIDINIKISEGLSQRTPMILVSKTKNASVIKAFIDAGANVNDVSTYDQTSPLLEACKENTHEVIELLLKHKADVEHRDAYGKTPLLLAIENKREPAIIRLLLEYGANPNSNDKQKKSPLRYALNYGYTDETIKAFIDNGVKIEEKDLINLAAQYTENIKLIPILLEQELDINYQNGLGDTPLHVALKNSTNIEMTMLLIEKGANVNIPNQQGETPLLIAMHKKLDSKIINLLLDKGANVNVQTISFKQLTPLILGIIRGYSLEILEKIIQKGANVRVRDDFQLTPLMHAVSKGYANITALLIKSGSDVNAVVPKKSVNYEHLTALMIACRNGHVGTAEILLNNGANTEARSGNDETILMQVASKGSVEVVKLLIKKGANINALSSRLDKKTALLIACTKNQTEVIKVLLEHGARHDIKTSGGVSALSLFESHPNNKNSAEIKKLFLDAGAK